MAETVALYDAKTHLSRLIDRAAAGEDIVITKNGKAMARLTGLPAASEPRRPAGAFGLSEIPASFDAPLPPDVLTLFDGQE